MEHVTGAAMMRGSAGMMMTTGDQHMHVLALESTIVIKDLFFLRM